MKTRIIFLCLLLLPIITFIFYIFSSDYSFTVLSTTQPTSIIPPQAYHELYAGHTIHIEFTSTQPNLALVGVRFNTFNRENDDQILVRLKETGAKDWYFTQTYRTTLVNGEIYNFGFIPIEDSQGKKYIIEITSLNGKRGNAIAFDHSYPIFITKYKFDKHSLSNLHTLQTFLVKKVLYMIQDTSVILGISTSMLPLIFFYADKKISNKNTVLYILFIVILCFIFLSDIFFLRSINNELYGLVIALWLVMHMSNKNIGERTFQIGLFFLLLTMLTYMTIGESHAIKAAGWGLVFLTFGVVVFLKRLNNKKTNKKNI